MPFSIPGDLLHPRGKPASPVSPALAGRLFITGATWEALCLVYQPGVFFFFFFFQFIMLFQFLCNVVSLLRLILRLIRSFYNVALQVSFKVLFSILFSISQDFLHCPTVLL